jgi:hypothetical protein
MFKRNVLIAAGAATLLACMSTAWAGSMETMTTVHRFADQAQVKGAEASLMRSHSGVAMKLSHRIARTKNAAKMTYSIWARMKSQF